MGYAYNPRSITRWEHAAQAGYFRSEWMNAERNAQLWKTRAEWLSKMVERRDQELTELRAELDRATDELEAHDLGRAA